MIYISNIDVYLCKRNRCTTKVLWVLKFWEVRGRDFFSKSQQVGRFLIFQSKLHVLSWFLLFLGKKRQLLRKRQPPDPQTLHHCGLSFCLMWTKGVLYDLLWKSSVIRKTSFVFNWYHVRRRVETKYEKAVNKKKSDRKRRKVSSIRQQHNLSAHRARNLDEEKRRRDTKNQWVARQRDPERRAAANRAQNLRQRRAAENRARYQEGLMFMVNS